MKKRKALKEKFLSDLQLQKLVIEYFSEYNLYLSDMKVNDVLNEYYFDAHFDGDGDPDTASLRDGFNKYSVAILNIQKSKSGISDSVDIYFLDKKGNILNSSYRPMELYWLNNEWSSVLIL